VRLRTITGVLCGDESGRNAESDAQAGDDEGVTDDQRGHIARGGAHRNPDADFAGPPCDGIGSSSADARDHQGEQRRGVLTVAPIRSRSRRAESASNRCKTETGEADV
jgi:hypothetical protein